MQRLAMLGAGLGAAAVGYKLIFEPWWQSWGWYGVVAVLRRQPLGIRDRVAGGTVPPSRHASDEWGLSIAA